MVTSDSEAGMGLRATAAALALFQVATGAWALVSPESWYSDFPGIGPKLVAGSPPFNEHLATDAGAGLLATALAVVIAAAWGNVAGLRMSLVGFVAFIAAHTIYHLLHRSPELSAGENAYAAGLLVTELVLGSALLILTFRRSGGENATAE